MEEKRKLATDNSTPSGGVLGVSGSRGDVGVAGPSGDKGQRGAAGGSGSAGQQGPKGIKGDPGMQVLSMSYLSPTLFRGTTGQEGEPGEKGSLGDMGPSGQAGANGTRGQKGEMGVAGHRGPRGAKGEPGPKGETGDPGPRGPAGDAGVVGPDGSSEDDGCICFELPTITGNFSDSVSVLEHHKLVLHCDVSDPTAKVTWRRTDGQSMPVNVNVTGNDIIFVAMAAVDAGVYECVTSSTVGDITKAVEITMIEPSKDDCDFEQGRFCLWTNTRDDKFDWTLNQGSTPTAHTGPTTDHTRGDGIGYYAFIETSDPRLNRDNARLASQVLNPSSPYCLNFWYYLYGQSIGNINVRPSEDAWHNAKISVPAQNTPFSLIIEGVRGDSYNGDAALDDITLTQGNCAP
nr:hypothetical protein BaRGS_001203 [Batillaria attramentaria]